MPRPVRYQQQRYHHQKKNVPTDTGIASSLPGGGGSGSGLGGGGVSVGGGGSGLGSGSGREGVSVCGDGEGDIPVFHTRSATIRKVPPPVGSLYQVVDNGNCSPR